VPASGSAFDMETAQASVSSRPPRIILPFFAGDDVFISAGGLEITAGIKVG